MTYTEVKVPCGHIRPLAVRPLDHPERDRSPGAFLFLGATFSHAGGQGDTSYRHVTKLTHCHRNDWQQHLYRVFYYDATPYEGKEHHPVLNRPLDFGNSDTANHRRAIFKSLLEQRKLALRLGKVNREQGWLLHPRLTTKLLRGRLLVSALDRLPDEITDSCEGAILQLSAEEARDLIQLRQDFQAIDAGAITLGLRQKGVDMRVGLDIASLTLKKQVDTIVLVSGDSDFVPAAKLARREGVDFILDPLWQKVNLDLLEHIDGLQSGLPGPGRKS